MRKSSTKRLRLLRKWSSLESSSYVEQSLHLKENPKKTIKYLCRYPAFITNHMDDKRVLGVLFAYQWAYGYILTCHIIGTSTFLFFSMAFHNYQIKLLGHRLSSCGHSKKRLEEQRGNELNDYVNVITLVKMHIDIKRWGKKNAFQSIQNIILRNLIWLIFSDVLVNFTIFSASHYSCMF